MAQGLLLNQKFDRMVGIVAVLQFAYPLYRQVSSSGTSLPEIAAICGALILISTMFTRRPPVRVTTNPFYWVLTFVASYGSLIPVIFLGDGIRLAQTL